MNTIFQTNLGTIHLWEIEEYDLKISAGEKKRSIEKESVLKKINELGFNDSLQKKESGQPFLENNPTIFISISHCQNQMALYIASKPVGIDIENERPRLFDGQSYYVNETEEKEVLNQERLQLIWGGKETLYKQFEGQILDLKNEVSLVSVNKLNNSIVLEYNSMRYNLEYRQLKNMWLVFTS